MKMQKLARYSPVPGVNTTGQRDIEMLEAVIHVETNEAALC